MQTQFILSDQQIARFWAKIDQRGPDDCWPWLAGRSKGYGQFLNYLAHRIAWFLTHGEIPAGAVIRHTCDNPPCCNPNHLVPGTHGQNFRDMVERGRASRYQLKQGWNKPKPKQINPPLHWRDRLKRRVERKERQKLRKKDRKAMRARGVPTLESLLADGVEYETATRLISLYSIEIE